MVIVILRLIIMNMCYFLIGYIDDILIFFYNSIVKDFRMEYMFFVKICIVNYLEII